MVKKTLVIIILLICLGGAVQLRNSRKNIISSQAIIPTAVPIENTLKEFIVKQAPSSTTLFTDQKELEKYIREYGPVATMKAIVDHSSITKSDCHEAAHRLGNLSYQINGKEVFGLNLPECHSGFYHGTIEAFFKQYGVENLKGNLSFICKGMTQDFFIHQCMHGIGHGLMAWTDYDLPKALEHCNLLPKANNQESCRGGVFMENITGGLGGDHTSKYVSDDPHYPCTIVKDDYKMACYFLQTDRMIQLSSNGFKGVAEECSKVEEKFRKYCYLSMGRTVSGHYKYRPKEAIAQCQYVSDPGYRKSCITAISQDMFWDRNGKDTALDFCSNVSELEGKEDCYYVITERAALFLSPQEQNEMCRQFPDKYQKICNIK